MIDWSWEIDNGLTTYGDLGDDAGLVQTAALPLTPSQLRHCPPRYALERTRNWAKGIAGDTNREPLRTLVFVSRRSAQTR